MSDTKREVIRGQDIAVKPNCGSGNNSCDCYPYPPFPPYPMPPYPAPNCPCPPCPPPVNSIEAQIAKLSKRSATIRRMIDCLVNRNKSIVMNIGGAQYNFGTYTNKEGEITEYGEKVLEILESELEAIKAKMMELVNELEVADMTLGDIDGTVTL